jgi:peptidoglycan hydrolase-like protein with peptidoglycan-binding domain
MSRSIWAAALAILALALVPGTALAASGGNAHDSHKTVVLAAGSGFPTPSQAVRSLQARLAAKGFSPGRVDGRFGPLTRAAVQRFQRADGLAVDGIVGPHTRHGLAAGGLLPGAGAIDPQGSSAVKRLQRRLERSGFSPGPVDGRYGPRTAAAVKRLQHARHLAATGIASAATLNALVGHKPHTNPAPKPNPKAKHNPAPAKPKPAPTHTNPAPATHPAAHKPASFPWTVLLVLLLVGVVAVGVWALLSLRTRRAHGGRKAQRQTAEPQVDQPPVSAQPTASPAEPAASPAQPAASPAQAVPAIAQAAAAMTAAAAKAPSDSAAEIAALEAAVAMPSAGSPQSHKPSQTKEVHKTVDTPGPVAVDDSELLEERLERVKALQRQLTWLGFQPGAVDGRYGPLTTGAVRAFQQVRGLAADGVADAGTLAALRAGTPQRPFSGRVQRVMELQRELTLRGYGPGQVDGRYGPHTTDAVKRFQREHGLPNDGVADQATLDALHGRPAAPPFSRREERVKQLQHQLTALGLEPGLVDGRYGPLTTDAVRRFQRAHDLPVDGIADPVTLNALKSTVNGSPFIVRTERVKELQRQLHRVGLEPGMVDGRYGPLTTEAVKRFQEAHGLPADGIADPETLNHIRKDTPTTSEHQLTHKQH